MKKGNISLVGVGSNSPFHTEQVVNNEGSAMVSSVGAIWRKSGATLLLTQGEEALTGADGRRLAAFTRSPLSFKDAAVRLTCRLGVNKKTCSLQGNRRFGGEGVCFERQKNPAVASSSVFLHGREQRGKHICGQTLTLLMKNRLFNLYRLKCPLVAREETAD